MLLRIWARRRRRRQQERREIEDGLRLLGESFEAPEHVKRAGLDRLLAEFERGRGRKR
jgi:hypothetical protein